MVKKILSLLTVVAMLMSSIGITAFAEETTAVATIGEATYATIEEAFAAATAGQTITLLADATLAATATIPAGVTLNGNGKQINGEVWAGGDLTIVGHTKVTNFNAGYDCPTITIGEGACLELTGSGRMVIGHGATFNITGTIADAKTANTAEITPSLIMPGASFTGAGVNFNVKNAYIKATAYCSSKNSNANNTFNFNVVNSIWEQSGSLVFSEPTNGKDPTINFNLKDSVLNSTSHLVFSVTKGEIVIDNSNVNSENNKQQLENRSTMTIKNGSVVYGTVHRSSNCINPGTTIVDNASYVTTGEFTGASEETGKLILKNGANATVDTFGDATAEIGAGCTLTTKTEDATKITAAPGCELKYENGVYTVAPAFVAKIGDVEYESLEDAFAAATEGQTITLLADATPALSSQRAITKAAVIDLGRNTLTLKEDDLYFGTTTFKNGEIVVDPSVKPSTAVFWMFENQTLTFDAVKITATGVTGTYLIGLDGNNSDLNLLNGSEIYVNNETALDLDIICVNASTGNDIVINNSKVNVTNLDGRVFFRGNYTVSGTSDIDLNGITKAGFRIEAGQTLKIVDTATVDIVGEPRDGGIHITDATATYTKADTAVVNASVNAPVTALAKFNGVEYETVAAALEAAKASGMSDVVITLVGATTKDSAIALDDAFNLYCATIFDSVTFKQEDASAPYYITGIKTGSRTNEGAFVFDGVNIVVTDQYILEGNVKLTNNSVLKSVAEANCFFYNNETIVEPGSKIYGVIEELRGGDVVIDGGRTDGAFNSVADVQDAIMSISWSGDSVTVKNGAYLKINAANEVGRLTVNAGASLNVYASKVEAVQWINNAGTINTDVNSFISASQIKGAGKISIDATNFDGNDVQVIAADMSGFTGTIEVINNASAEAKIENGKVYVVAKAAPAVAKIGDVEYASLKEAIDAANANDTITVIADIADEAVFVDKNLTITGSVSLNNVSINAIEGCSELTVSNLSFTGNSWINSGAASKLTVEGVTANVTPSNTAMTNSRSAFISLGRTEAHNLELTVKNCKIVSAGGSDPVLGWASITKATITGNTFGSSEAYQKNSDSVKFMAIADGAEFTITNNTIYSNYNGIVFGQNTTRDNAYSVVLENNAFFGAADHIWIEVSGADTTNAAINASSTNTVNGNAFKASDIKVHPNIKNWKAYAGVDVVTDENGKVIGGKLALYNEKIIADDYAALPNLDGNYVVGKKPTATVKDHGATVIPAGGYGIWDGKNYTSKGTTEMPLNFVVEFLADETAAEGAASPYADWYADFVITFDGLENGSFLADGCYLAGFYGDFGWVKVPVDGMTIENGVRYPVMLGVGLGQKYDYICSGVKDFKCAMFLTPEILEANPNLEVNLELAMVDNSKGQTAARDAIINNNTNVYSVTEKDYVAEDFKPETASGKVAYRAYVANTDTRKAVQIDLENVKAKESLVIEMYSGDTKISTTTLKEANFPVDASAYTVNAVWQGKASGSWDTVWHVELTEANIPDSVKVYADGVLTDTFTHESGTILADKLGEYKEMIKKLFDFSGATVTLGNSMTISFFAKQEYFDGQDYYMILEHKLPDGTTDKKKYEFAEWEARKLSNVDYYVVSYSNLSAKQIADEICVTIYKQDGTQISNTRVDGLSAYAYRTIATTTNSELRTALVDMLNYGAAAQVQFNYNTANLANANADTYQQYATSDISHVKNERVSDSNYVGTTLTLENNIQLTGYFKNLTSDMKAIVTFKDHYGEDQIMEVAGKDFVKFNSTTYGVCVDTLVVADAAQLVTIVVYNADGTVYSTLVDSMNGYLARSIDNGDIYPATAKFVTSAYNYLH